jgi:hypothetical protein
MRRWIPVVKAVAVATLILFVVRVFWVNSNEVQEAARSGLLRLRMPYLLASYALLAAYLLSRAAAWHLITLRTHTAIPAADGLATWLTANLAKYIPGKVMILIWRAQIYRRFDVAGGHLTVAFGLEVLIEITGAAMLVTLLLGFIELPDVMGFSLERLVWLAPLCLVALHPRVVNWTLRRLAAAVGRSIPPYDLRFPTLLLFLALSMFNWLLFGLAHFLMIRAMYELAWSDAALVIAAMALATIVGFVVPFAPAGLGVREGLLLPFLATTMPLGVASLVVVVLRVWMTLGELVVAGCAYVWRRASRRPSREPVLDA